MDWCLIFLFCQAWISLLRLPDPRAKRNTVLKVKCFKEASLIGSNGVLAGARPVRSSRRVCHSCLWVCLRGNYPGDERDFRPCWCWRVNFPVYQQWVTYNHQWCWAVCQACISLLRLPDPRAKRKTALKVKCFKEAFNWLKMNLVTWCKNQEEVPGGDSPPAFGSVSVEAIQEKSEIFILTDIDGQIFQTISNGWPVTINGTGLQLPVLKQVHKEVSNWLYRGCPKSTWWMIHHLLKNDPFAS